MISAATPPSNANEALQRIFDAAAFRTQGHLMVDQLADYLAAALGRQPMAVLPWLKPGAMMDAGRTSCRRTPRPILSRSLRNSWVR